MKSFSQGPFRSLGEAQAFVKGIQYANELFAEIHGTVVDSRVEDPPCQRDGLAQWFVHMDVEEKGDDEEVNEND